MTPRLLYAQGDVLLERVDTPQAAARDVVCPDPDGAVVLGRGEASGHRHALHANAVLFHDQSLARDLPSPLYIGHLEVSWPQATLIHEEHAPIVLPPGTYRVRRQREFSDLPGMRFAED